MSRRLSTRVELVLLLLGSAVVCGIMAIVLVATASDHRPGCAVAAQRHAQTDEFRDDARVDFFGLNGPDRRAMNERAAVARLADKEDPRYTRCSTTCQCTHAGLSSYGRWCGYRHSGCEGYGACDMLDECCQTHDHCVGSYGYTNCTCTTALAKCAMCAYTAPITMDDVCGNRNAAALRVLSDIRYVLPSCFSDALAK